MIFGIGLARGKRAVRRRRKISGWVMPLFTLCVRVKTFDPLLLLLAAWCNNNTKQSPRAEINNQKNGAAADTLPSVWLWQWDCLCTGTAVSFSVTEKVRNVRPVSPLEKSAEKRKKKNNPISRIVLQRNPGAVCLSLHRSCCRRARWAISCFGTGGTPLVRERVPVCSTVRYHRRQRLSLAKRWNRHCFFLSITAQ